MRQKILIGSMLVLALLLLMPSIPAIQQKTIEEGIKQDLQEKLDSITLDDLEDIKDLEWKRHPILYVIVVFLTFFRIRRAQYLFSISSHYEPREIVIDNPLIFMRGWWLASSAYVWLYFWYIISSKLRWNWDLYY